MGATASVEGTIPKSEEKIKKEMIVEYENYEIKERISKQILPLLEKECEKNGLKLQIDKDQIIKISSKPIEKKSLNVDQISAIRTSFRNLRNQLNDEAIGTLLFENIFKEAPEARSLFPMTGENFNKHIIGVIKTIALAIEMLDSEDLASVLRNLGARHLKYGVKANHIPIAGKAFLITLKQGLGQDLFTLALQEAYTVMWAFVQENMLAGINAAVETDSNERE